MATRSTQLTIGEFSAVTQLSPKALRLYDEQRLLPPAQIDSANGYRYYDSSQIARGRLIRTLREMNLALGDIAAVLAAPPTRASALLSSFSKQQQLRRAREQRAFQTALYLLREQSASAASPVDETARAATLAVVESFTTQAHAFAECFQRARQAAENTCALAGLATMGEPYCALLEPLTEDNAQLEIIVPVAAPAQLPQGPTVRQLPAMRHASLVADSAGASDIAGAVDALFDWFDRHACHTIGVPCVSFVLVDNTMRTQVSWAYEPPEKS